MKRLVLPYPPSTNRIWRKAGNRIVMSDEAKAFKRAVFVLAKAGAIGAPLTGSIALSMILHPPALNKLGRKAGAGIDLSNCIKLAEDALQGLAYANDKQVVDIRVRRGVPAADGLLVVEWEEL